MAARVNVKFVVILSTVLVLVFAGAATTAYFVATKSAEDYVALGDEQAAEGNWTEAARMYERAVGHAEARNNLEYLNKWLDALEKTSDDRLVVYEQRFFTKYRPLLRQIAITDRGNIEAQKRYLDVLLEQTIFSPYSPESHLSLVAEAEEMLRYHEGEPDDGAWSALRRYRGIARSRMVSANSQVSEAQVEQAEEDLLAALAIDPSDEASVLAYTQLKAAISSRARLEGREDIAEEELDAAAERLRSFVQTYPSKIQAGVAALRLDLFEAAQSLAQAGGIDEAKALEMASAFKPKLDALETQVRENGAGALTATDLLQIRSVEPAIEPERRGERTLALAEWAAEAQPENPQLLLVLAEFREAAGQTDKAMEALARVDELENKPMSLSGLQLFAFRQRAVEQQARLAISRWNDAAPEARDALLAEARKYRDELARFVASDSPALQLADARLLVAEGKLEEAQRLLTDYNTRTARSDADALAIAGRLAMRQQQLGVARDQFERVLELEGSNVEALIQLARINEELGELDAAERLYERVTALTTESEEANSGLRRLRLLQGTETSDDPVEAALFEAERYARGTAVEPADPRAAIERLRQAAEDTDFNPRIVNALGRRLLDLGERADALAVVRAGLERRPEDEGLLRLERIFAAEDPTEELVRLIDESERTPLAKALTKYEVFVARGRTEEALAALEEAERIAPNDERVIELAFVRAVSEGDRARAGAVADRAAAANTDTLGGLTYRARVQLIDGDYEGAISTLDRALETDRLNWIAWRLLGRTRLLAGRENEALAAFREAVSIRPNESGLLVEYIRTLARLGQMEEALAVAREREAVGRENAAFVQTWLDLEAREGDRNLARDRRERLLELYPADRTNRAALARVHMDLGNWDRARALIDGLRNEADTLGLVQLDAEWHAAQNDLGGAQGVFAEYIIEQDPEEVGSAPYILMGSFMLERGVTDQGLEALRQARDRQRPEFREADRALGEALMSLGRFEEAIDPLQAIVDAGADDPDQSFRKRLIESLIRAGREGEAESQIAALPSAQQDDVTTLMLRADVARRQGRTEDAVSLLNQAVVADPTNPVIYVQRARVLSQDPARRADSMADLDEALRIQPGFLQALRLKAQALFEDGREAEAIDQIRLAVEANPNQTELRLQLLNELLRTERSGEAVEIAEAAIESRPRDLQLKLNTASLFSRYNDWPRASRFLQMAWGQSKQVEIGQAYMDALLTLTPPNVREAQAVMGELTGIVDISRNARMLSQRAMIFNRLGREQQATSDATDAWKLVWEQIDRNPEAALIWLGWMRQVFETSEPLMNYLRTLETVHAEGDARQQAWITLLRGRMMMADEADRTRGTAMLERLAEDSQDPLVRVLSNRSLAGAAFELGDYDTAASRWAAVLDINNRDWESANNLAFTLVKHLDRVGDAAPYAEMAAALQPENPQVLDTLGWVRLKQGRHEEARSLLNQALSKNPSADTRFVVLVHAAQNDFAMGDIEGARERAEEATRLGVTLGTPPEAYAEELEALKRELGSR